MAPSTCSECTAPYAEDQRFCLACGARLGAPLPERLRLAAPPPPASPEAAPRGALARAVAVLPGPRVAAALVLLMLGAGVGLGAAAGPRAERTLAAARAPLAVELPPAAPAAPDGAPAEEEPLEEAPLPPEEPLPAEDAPPPAAEAPLPATEDDLGAAPGSGEAPARPAPDPAPSPAEPRDAPSLGHVWVVALAEQPAARTFGDAAAMPYLAGLTGRGAVLPRFAAVGPSGLATGVALLSGGEATPDQAFGCPAWTAVADGRGCVFGTRTETLPAQLDAAGLTWRAYVQDAPGPCPVPAPGQIGTPALARNPFLAFRGVTGDPAACRERVGPLGPLARDLARERATPAFSYLVPGLCFDGRDAPCAPGAAAGPAAADAWLRLVLPGILASPAFRDDGLVVVTSDHAPGGEPVGALLLSPRIRGGTVSERPYDTFSLLRAVQDGLGLGPLGESAGTEAHPRLGRDVWTAWRR